MAQESISSVDQFRAAMQRLADVVGTIEAMAPAPIYLLNSARGYAISQLDDARQTMESVRGVFEAKGRENAVRDADAVIAEIEVLDEILSLAEPDQAAAIDAVGAVGRTCQACHDAQREGDPERGYWFKAPIF